MPPVSGIAKGAEVGVVGRNDDEEAARFEQAVKLFDGADYIGHMFDDVRGPDLTEGAVTERKWKIIQVCDHVGPGTRITIQA